MCEEEDVRIVACSCPQLTTSSLLSYLCVFLLTPYLPFQHISLRGTVEPTTRPQLLQMQPHRSSEDEQQRMLDNQIDQFTNFVTTAFPVAGARRTGSQTQAATPISQISGEKLERHQRIASGSALDQPYHSNGGGIFPASGAEPVHAVVSNAPFDGYDISSASAGPSQIQQTTSQQSHTATQSPSQPLQHRSDPDPIASFLAEMPTEAEDPTRHVLWTELIRLKTRSLELQIAEARRKEKEAELELARLQSGAVSKSDNENGNPMAGPSGAAGVGIPSGTSYVLPQQHMVQQQQQQEQQHVQPVPQGPTFNPTQQLYGGVAQNQNQHAVSPFDLDAMLQTDLTNFLSWLPDLGNNEGIQADGLQNTSDSNMPLGTLQPPSIFDNSTASRQSPTRHASHSPSNSPPPAKRSKRTAEKKTVIEKSSACIICSKPLARVMIRAPKSRVPDPITVSLKCPQCAPVKQPSTLPDSNQASSATASSIGTVETRKRMRTSMEIDDEEAKVSERRTWCDVCQRIVGSGQVCGGKDRENILHQAEIICTGCDSKYQRCTDCGGGGGPRVGIGKWRMKQVFHPGRKTCSLSHTRLGDRTRELGVHVTPTDFTPEQMKEVLSRCKTLWNEKTLSRLAIPEMLEVDLPPSLANPLRDFADVDDIVTRNWPSREAMIRADGLNPLRFKRLLSLIWAHSKPRRSVRTVDLEEEWSKQADENDEDDMSTVLANVKRTNVVIPAGSELIGMWGGEWDMQNGSLLISTFIPFEGTDGEDSTALSVGEMITKVQGLQQEINAERIAQAEKDGTEPELLPPCQHLWTVSGGYIPLVRERFADILIRKRAFVHVEEYLTRHPEFIECIKARPVGLHPDIHRPVPQPGVSESNGDDQSGPRPLILVRWLGKDFDAEKILEIKQMEFGGGKAKVKKRLRSKA
ncbi:hypothetical protein C348_04325 [Cryptococcus neoformans Gb118]|nr:hypothetical protein C350_04078 [Cryptococcus neoformans var. grubii MW-RSA36]OXL07540.1 hypothetical protein C348_04325 [Cryptococcus neoformans var. grubii Gb118]